MAVPGVKFPRKRKDCHLAVGISPHINIKDTSSVSERTCKWARDGDEEAGEPGCGAHGTPHTTSADLPSHPISREGSFFSGRSGQPIVFAVFSPQNKVF